MVVNINFWVEEPVLAFLVVFLPLILLWGMKGMSDWIVSFIKVRQGFFSVNWVMKNHQWREKMVKPKGNDVNVEGKPQPFINDPHYTAFKGSKKMIFFSRVGERLRQLMIKADTDKDMEKQKGIPPESEFNDMLDAAEISGTIFGLKKSQVERYLLFIAVGAACGALIFGFINLGMLNAMDSRLNNTDVNVGTLLDRITIETKTTSSTSNLPLNTTNIGG